MSFEYITALALFALVSSITPGPNNLMLMASGANFGIMRTLPHAFGVNLGFTAMLALVGLGLTRVFDAFPVTLIILRVASILFLLYLAWKIATAAPLAEGRQDAATSGKPMTFLQAASFQWVNPKAWSMGLTALGAYNLPDAPTLSVIAIVVVFMIVNLPAITTWMLLGTQMRRFLSEPLKLRIFNIVMAVLLVASLIPSLMHDAAA